MEVFNGQVLDASKFQKHDRIFLGTDKKNFLLVDEKHGVKFFKRGFVGPLAAGWREKKRFAQGDSGGSIGEHGWYGSEGYNKPAIHIGPMRNAEGTSVESTYELGGRDGRKVINLKNRGSGARYFAITPGTTAAKSFKATNNYIDTEQAKIDRNQKIDHAIIQGKINKINNVSLGSPYWGKDDKGLVKEYNKLINRYDKGFRVERPDGTGFMIKRNESDRQEATALAAVINNRYPELNVVAGKTFSYKSEMPIAPLNNEFTNPNIDSTRIFNPSNSKSSWTTDWKPTANNLYNTGLFDSFGTDVWNRLDQEDSILFPTTPLRTEDTADITPTTSVGSTQKEQNKTPSYEMPVAPTPQVDTKDTDYWQQPSLNIPRQRLKPEFRNKDQLTITGS